MLFVSHFILFFSISIHAVYSVHASSSSTETTQVERNVDQATSDTNQAQIKHKEQRAPQEETAEPMPEQNVPNKPQTHEVIVQQQQQQQRPNKVRTSTTMKKKITKPWHPNSVNDLHREYNKIFRYGNRNAASHLWTKFILDRSHFLDADTLEQMFAGFCAVSGSPVGPNDYNRYGLNLRYVPGHKKFNRYPDGTYATRFGYMHYCCWPCVCDTQDFFWIDTKTVELVDGEEKTYHFVVLGDPCEKEEKLDQPFVQPFDVQNDATTTLRHEAAEIRCKDKKLIGAARSDNGYTLVNMFFDTHDDNVTPTSMIGVDPLNSVEELNSFKEQPGRVRNDYGVTYQHEKEWGSTCADRARQGYNSGMGEIFRKVAEITPIEKKAQNYNFVNDGSSEETQHELL